MTLLLDDRERKAAAAGDALQWEPMDALRSVMRDIEAGVIDPEEILIVMRLKTDESDEDEYYQYACAGMTNPSLFVMLSRMLESMCGAKQ